MLDIRPANLTDSINARLQGVKPLSLTPDGLERWKQNRYGEVMQLLVASDPSLDILGRHRDAVVIVDDYASRFTPQSMAHDLDEIAVMGWAAQRFDAITATGYCCLEGEPQLLPGMADPTSMRLDEYVGEETSWPMYSNLMNRGWELVGSYVKQSNGKWESTFDKWPVEITDGQVTTNVGCVSDKAIKEAMSMQHGYVDLMIVTDKFVRMNFTPFHWQILSLTAHGAIVTPIVRTLDSAVL